MPTAVWRQIHSCLKSDGLHMKLPRAHCLCAGLVFLSAVTAAMANPPAEPNIIFILADDLGWTGVGCFGSDFYDQLRWALQIIILCNVRAASLLGFQAQ